MCFIASLLSLLLFPTGSNIVKEDPLVWHGNSQTQNIISHQQLRQRASTIEEARQEDMGRDKDKEDIAEGGFQS